MTTRLSDFFQLSETETDTHAWILATPHPTDLSPEQALAEALADRIVEHLCRGCTHLYQAWKQSVYSGEPMPAASRKAIVEGFIGPIFGTPEDPDAVPKDHLEGFVAQLLWYFLHWEVPPEEIIRVEPPGFKATDPGGDALAIHRVQSDYLMFRLWEIKKYSGDLESTTSVSSTVSSAYGQLDAKALEYLARYTAIGQELADPELADFYGQLVELWLDSRKEAAAGVAVATSSCHVPGECFTTFGDHFPGFVDPLRLRGMLTAVEDLSGFALRVREFIWRGL